MIRPTAEELDLALRSLVEGLVLRGQESDPAVEREADLAVYLYRHLPRFRLTARRPEQMRREARARARAENERNEEGRE